MITTKVDGGRFRLIYKSKNHHYLWRERKSNALVLSDHSADDMYDEPSSVENTDDGVLYVDVDRIREAGGLVVYRYDEDKISAFVPLFKVSDSKIEKSRATSGYPTITKLLSLPEFEGCENLLFDVGGDKLAKLPLK